MRAVLPSRTKRARATKAFEEVRVGSVRLYFSHFELIGFQRDGHPPVVCAPPKPIGPTTSADIEQHRRHLEPDPAKWLTRNDFERVWEDMGTAAGTVPRSAGREEMPTGTHGGFNSAGPAG